jgi:hypothetical protein
LVLHETRVFGSEFVAMKTAMESNRRLWYNLRMMEVPLDNSSDVFENKQFAIVNSSQTE